MFSSGRAVRSVCSISANAARGPASTRIAAPPRPFCTHQRRQSSTSCPPDGSKGPNTPQQDAARPSATSAGEGEGRSSRRSSRRKARQAAAIAPPAHEDSGVLYSLPRVPPTHHLQESGMPFSARFSRSRANIGLRCRPFVLFLPPPPDIDNLLHTYHRNRSFLQRHF